MEDILPLTSHSVISSINQILKVLLQMFMSLYNNLIIIYSNNCNHSIFNYLHTDHIDTSELSGQHMEHWTEVQWKESIKNNDILVGTPEVFRRSFIDKAFVDPTLFSLIVFDECHNAAGNAPMASIMRDSVIMVPELIRPRILGLTASFVSGSVNSEDAILKKRNALETLLQASLYSPIIPVQAGDKDIDDKYSLISYPDENLRQYEEFVKNFVRGVLKIIPSRVFDKIETWVDRGWNIFNCLGSEGLRYDINKLH